ncbi:NINE protein [Arenibacter sp. ARW7G5Y1]|uniref:NINE protein n=1 Tax=Arenibacter sp. ARW7G5Y1 TaxID=2135619 RepID=UPI000D76F28F|nr:NINE protein [Arenibacter sp. ARW7G5Y1]PXX30716.1 TM2 domain-containing membrane protein YozV [Arenibacter sp. ARW7G5Y1]
MSEENKDLGDKPEDAAKGAKESAKEFANDAKESAKEFADETKEAAKDFGEEAKKTANEFKEGLANAGGDNKKILAGVLAIVFGQLGVHKFILGYQKEGIIMLVATVVGYATMCLFIGTFIVMATAIIGLIEGIIYLTKSDEEFYNTYQVGKKPWF